MKKSPNFVTRKLQGKVILAPIGKAALDMDGLITMNNSATYLWDALGDNEFTQDDIVRLLLDHYDISPETARSEAASAISQWTDCGAVE